MNLAFAIYREADGPGPPQDHRRAVGHDARRCADNAARLTPSGATTVAPELTFTWRAPPKMALDASKIVASPAMINE